MSSKGPLRGLMQCCLVAVTSFSLAGLCFAATSVAAMQTERSCRPGEYLRGTLIVNHTSCATGRLVSFGYFASTPPGQHTGPAEVDGFHCYGRVIRVSRRYYNFRINCHRGRARTHFLGVGK
jgi:hypothetical protein